MHDAGVAARLVGGEAVLLLEHHDLAPGHAARELPSDGEPHDPPADDPDRELAHHPRRTLLADDRRGRAALDQAVHSSTLSPGCSMRRR
jgi:hypothetical protein